VSRPPRILVTRQPEQSGELREGLRAMGAEVVEVPVFQIVPPLDASPLDAALKALGLYAWVVFTSANAVAAVAARLRELGLGWVGPEVAAVGPATSAALRGELPDVPVALEPAHDHRAEGMLAAFAGRDLSGLRVLVPASDRARDVLAAGLRGLGAEVDVVTAYRNVPLPDLGERLAAVLAAGADLVTFASPSAVEGFAAAASAGRPLPPAAVIGPVTEAAARRAGIEVAVVAAPSTAAGLLHVLRGWLAGRANPPSA
jgi:uroporphyrinogen III methyltransferase/synthase